MKIGDKKILQKTLEEYKIIKGFLFCLIGSHCGGIENDTAYPAAGGEYAKTRILSCIIGKFAMWRTLDKKSPRKSGQHK